MCKTRYEIRVERITASTLEELVAKVEAVELKEGERACSYALWKHSQQHSSSNPLFVKVIFGGLWCIGHRSLLMRMRIACSIDEVISM